MLNPTRGTPTWLIAGVCCACGPGLPDESGDHLDFNFTVTRWKIEDAASGAELSVGCFADAQVYKDTAPLLRFQAEPGQRVKSVIWNEVGSKDQGGRGSEYLCSTRDDDLPRGLVSITVNLECWTFVEPGPVRVVSAELVPSARPQDVQQYIDPPQTVAGAGRSFELEVLGPGVWKWEPSGLCTYGARTELEVLPP